MRALRTYTIQDRNRAIALYRSGLSGPRVAQRLGFPKMTVYVWLKVSRVSRSHSEATQLRRAGSIWITPDVLADLASRVERGESGPEIAAHYKMPYRRMAGVLQRSGIRTSRHPAKSRPMTTPKGRARLERVRECARLRADGLSFRDIGRRVGLTGGAVRYSLKTPFGRALMACVHGNEQTTQRKMFHALAMYGTQHLPVAFIAKVVDADPGAVECWVHGKPAPRKGKSITETTV